jgi:hypothetical protein
MFSIFEGCSICTAKIDEVCELLSSSSTAREALCKMLRFKGSADVFVAKNGFDALASLLITALSAARLPQSDAAGSSFSLAEAEEPKKDLFEGHESVDELGSLLDVKLADTTEAPKSAPATLKPDAVLSVAEEQEELRVFCTIISASARLCYMDEGGVKLCMDRWMRLQSSIFENLELWLCFAADFMLRKRCEALDAFVYSVQRATSLGSSASFCNSLVDAASIVRFFIALSVDR